MNELWKDIKNYEGLYKISDLGRIKNHYGRIIVDFKEPNRLGNYIAVVLINNKIRKTFMVHRLVAEAFVMNVDNKPIVNHMNAIKNDPRACNLEWVTQTENLIHAIEFYKANPELKPSYLRHQIELKENQKTKIVPLDEHGHEILYFNPVLHEKYHYCDY